MTCQQFIAKVTQRCSLAHLMKSKRVKVPVIHIFEGILYIWWYSLRHWTIDLFNEDTGSNGIGHRSKCRPLIGTSSPGSCLLFSKSRGQPFTNLFRHSLWLQLRQIIANGFISEKAKKCIKNVCRNSYYFLKVTNKSVGVQNKWGIMEAFIINFNLESLETMKKELYIQKLQLWFLDK